MKNLTSKGDRMRYLLALLFLGSVAHAKPATEAKPAAPAKPTKMPREKALIIQNAELQQKTLELQVEDLNRQIAKAQEDLKSAQAERDSVVKEYGIDPGDRVNPKTGEITRATPPPPVPRPEAPAAKKVAAVESKK